MRLYESVNLMITYQQDKSLFLLDWLPQSSNMTDDIYKKEMLTYVELLEEHRPAFVLFDTSKSEFVVGLNMQEWANENIIVRAAKTNLRKTAFVMSKEFISQLSIEQAVEEDKQRVVTRQYFADLQSAVDWLLA